MRLPYHLIHLGGRRGWWRPVLGVLLLAFIVFFFASIFWLFPFALWYAVRLGSAQETVDAITALADLDNPTPASLAYLNLILASAIPAAWLVSMIHGIKPRWLASVAPRIRWPYFFACLGLSVIALAVTMLVSAVLPSGGGSELSGDLNAFTSTTRDFLLVVLLLTPLQAAGEEYFFRGYLLQAFGGLGWKMGEKSSAAFGIVASSVLFAIAHGAQDVPIFFDRLAFGLVAGTLVVLTGGLEAGIAMHVLNNFLAFGLALAFSDMGSALNPSGGSWWNIPVTLTQSLTYLALALWAYRRMGLKRTTDQPVLEARPAPVYRSPSV